MTARISLSAIILLIAAACNGEDAVSGPDDLLPPVVTIVEPRERQVVTSTEPGFLITVSDNDTGISCASINATIGGSDVSSAFRAACSLVRGEVRIPRDQDRIILTVEEHTLVFRISDGAGNQTTATRTFTVAEEVPEPPPK